MPTASTSQILGFNECFEPYTSGIYTRRVLAGEFQIVNPWLLKELVEMGLWDDEMKNRIIAHQSKGILDMAADRGAFIDQSQSLNIHLQAPTFGQLTSMHFYAWKKGLKTGIKPAATLVSSNAGLLPTSGLSSSKVLKQPLNDISNTQPKVSSPPSGSNNNLPSTSSSTKPLVTPYLSSYFYSEVLLALKKLRKRAEQRELEQAQLMCSLENPGACTMCSG
ncbi:hypothetical protein Pst134EA_032598 [Puccinia striiformis f. sp. tritici]|uniref:uncharacterized protein n=1 Tax=Puccinia striiformis f. sp. tritici TaxID=168172 RepID=UPI002008CB87|nr:uncharacterized protein Pst134EA_032598 [Puccinia striiformis f. sp. tritici]KAH9441693.1 hypothetical protein Pst134EA_032598 [Puccinia striiformis f. sp. tritici]